ncbi:MAG: hypothetical protein WDZ37_02660 [Solirubrobacterales bacterium]
MESRASAASADVLEPTAAPRPAPPTGTVAVMERCPRPLDALIAVGIAAVLAATAFIGNGGLQLGATTLAEVLAIVTATMTIVASVLVVGFEARLHGGVALVATAALAALSGLSILWSLSPSDSWLEANRTISYVAVFAAGMATVRLARRHWEAALTGVLGALALVSLYGLATKVVPGLLAADEVFARLREPYGYWNAVGVTAAMGVPLCLWLGTRERTRDWTAALAYPLLTTFIVTILLSYSRGSILAALVAAALWCALVPLRLRSLALLAPALAVAIAVVAWVYSQGVLSDNYVPLAQREDSGIVFGLVLVAALAVAFVCGLAIARRVRVRPLSDAGRRRAGVVALVALALIPIAAAGAMAASERGIGGTVSDRWHDLTHERGTPTNDPGRLTETGSVRSIYFPRALEVWKEHRLKGAGAGAFDKAQLRFRDSSAQGRHAHGYVHQTLADLGLLGLGVSLGALIAWLVAATATLGMRPGRWRLPWSGERAGMAALALVAVAFGVHSTIDWTWFVPAVAMIGLFAAGWVAGRGPIAVGADAAGRGAPPLDLVKGPSMPSRRTLLRRSPIAAGVLLAGVLASLVVAAPWRGDRRSDDAIELATRGDLVAARQAASDSRRINPFSPEPYFDFAAIETQAGDKGAALAALQMAVQREPANPATWQRLGEYYLGPLNQPERAIPVLRGAVYLDPYSPATHGALLLALRAEQLQQQAAKRAPAK